MSIFEKATEIIQPRVGKNYRIEHYEVGEDEIKNSRIRDAFRGLHETCGIKPGKYVRLLKNNRTVMSNTPMEMTSHSEFIREANGKVLIGGLGLGLILLDIMDKEQVTHVEIVEKSEEVINLVWFQLPINEDKVTCHQGDILEWWPDDNRKWDTIYFDIWTNISTDNYEDMKRLHRRFGRRLNRDNPNAWMGSWRRSYIEYLKRREDRERRRWR